MVTGNNTGLLKVPWVFVDELILFFAADHYIFVMQMPAHFWIWGQIIELLQLFSVWPKWNAVSVEHILKQKGGNHSLMKMVILPYITCSWHNFSKPNLAIVCLSWNVPLYKFLLGLELPKTHNDRMRTMNFGQRMSFSCFYGNGGKHKTDKKEHVCQKKSVNTFENSCAQNATKESHKFWMNFVPWTEPLGFGVPWPNPVPKGKSKRNLNQKKLQAI